MLLSHPRARRSRAARHLAQFLGAALVLAAALFVAAVLVLRGSLPKRHGRVRVPGLLSTVTVTFDARGVPQIWAARESDAWFALGWVHASDRLFEMDLFRRLATGRLGELLGSRALGVDAEQRLLGFERMADDAVRRLDPGVRENLDAYVAGVNAWIGRGRPPFEYRVLRAAPRPWSLEDVAASFLYQAYDLTPIVPDDFHELLTRIPDQRAFSLLLPDSLATPTITGAPALSGSRAVAAPAAEAHGSNAWVVAPSLTGTGGALLANDPHLDVGRLPGPLYLAGVHADDTHLDAVGATIPGLPFFPLGHNGRCGWGATASGAFLGAVVRAPAGRDSSSYAWRGAERAFDARPETLRARGSANVRVVTVRRTHLGPVVARGEDGSWRVLRWVGYELPLEDALAGGFGLLHSHDFSSFRAAVGALGSVGISWVYADRDGHIGYQLGGRLPRYEAGAPYRIVADPDSGWSEIAPFDLNPHLLDPPRGWIVAANDPPAPGIPGAYAFERARSLESVMHVVARSVADTAQAPGRFRMTPLAAHEVQLMRVSRLGLRYRALAAAAARAAGSDSIAAGLESWAGDAAGAARVPAVFFTWWKRLPAEIFGDEVGPGLPYVTATAVLTRVLDDPGSPWWDDIRTQGRESREQILARAMRTAVAEVHGRTWGEVHVYHPAHPFASLGYLDRLLRLSRGPFPIGGDGSTVNVARGTGQAPPFVVTHGPVCRFVVDLTDPDGAMLNESGGQSGNPVDRHFADFIPSWISGEPWKVPFTRKAVEARAVETVELVPR